MSERRRTLAWLGAGVALLLLWLALQFPEFLFRWFTVAIPGDIATGPTVVQPGFWGGDHIQVFYLAWKLGHDLFTRWSIFSDPYTYASQLGRYWDVEVTPQYWPVVLLAPLVGHVAAYNLGFVLLPLFASLVGGWFLFGQVTQARWLRLVAALWLTLLPYRWLQLVGGHGGGSIFALAVWYWWAVLRHRFDERSRRGDLVAGVLLFGLVAGDLHQGFYTLLASALVYGSWAIADVRAGGWPALGRLLARHARLVAALVAVVAWVLIVRKLQMVDAAGAAKVQRTIGEIRSYSYPLPYFVDDEATIGGVVLRVLPFAALLALAARRSLASRYWGFVAALALCMTLMVGIGDHWSQRLHVYRFFYEHVPLFATQRVPAKIFSTAALLLAILVCALFEACARSDGAGRRLGRAAQVLIAVAAVLQPLWQLRFIHRGWPGLRLSDMRWGPRDVLARLRTLGRDDIVLDVPFDVHKGRYETLTMYLAYKSHARFADGYSGAPPDYFARAAPILSAVNRGELGEVTRRTAREQGYTYLLLMKSPWPLAEPPSLIEARLEASGSLDKLVEEDGAVLYRFR